MQQARFSPSQGEESRRRHRLQLRQQRPKTWCWRSRRGCRERSSSHEFHHSTHRASMLFRTHDGTWSFGQLNGTSDHMPQNRKPQLEAADNRAWKATAPVDDRSLKNQSFLSPKHSVITLGKGKIQTQTVYLRGQERVEKSYAKGRGHSETFRSKFNSRSTLSYAYGSNSNTDPMLIIRWPNLERSSSRAQFPEQRKWRTRYNVRQPRVHEVTMFTSSNRWVTTGNGISCVSQFNARWMRTRLSTTTPICRWEEEDGYQWRKWDLTSKESILESFVGRETNFEKRIASPARVQCAYHQRPSKSYGDQQQIFKTEKEGEIILLCDWFGRSLGGSDHDHGPDRFSPLTTSAVRWKFKEREWKVWQLWNDHCTGAPDKQAAYCSWEVW